MNIIEAISDRNLFGGLSTFRDLSTWRAWLTFVSAFYGLPLSADEVERFKKHTGRSYYSPPPGGWREAACIVGRQSGKSRVAALVAGYEAALAEREADGTELFALMVSQDHRASMRTILRYACAPFEVAPMLAATVTAKTADTLTLDSGMVLAAYPCRPAAVRGLRAKVAVLDELAFYIAAEGNPIDREMLRAVRPCLATTGGKLLVLSSPYGATGALWDLHRKHHGRDDSSVLVWQASASDMNPTLPADYLARMAEDDPEAYRSEVLGEFRSGTSQLFDAEALDAVVVPERCELPRVAGIVYSAFVDPSGGRSDAFTIAIGHALDGRAVVDVVRAWRPPLNPTGTVAETSALLKSYGVGDVVGDRYAGEWPREAFRARGVSYTVAEKPKSDLYLELLAAVNSGRVELPDMPDLLRELRGLERRRGSSGRDRVDHRPGAHDDLANAVAGVVVDRLLREEPGVIGWARGEVERRRAERAVAPLQKVALSQDAIAAVSSPGSGIETPTGPSMPAGWVTPETMAEQARAFWGRR